MNCPTCLSVMYDNQTSDSNFINLNCHNSNCKAKQQADARTSMQVMAKPNEKWSCLSYYLPFLYKNHWVALSAKSLFDREDRPHTKIIPIFKQDPELHLFVQIFTDQFMQENKPKPLIIVNHFIPISTDNDMHQHATMIFNHLMNISIPQCQVPGGRFIR